VAAAVGGYAPATVDEDRHRSGVASDLTEVAREIGAAALYVPEIQNAVRGVTLAILSVIFVPLGLAFLVLSAFLFVIIFGALGLPPGAITTALGTGWWIGTLVAMFFIFQRIYRWLAARRSPLASVVKAGFDPPEVWSPRSGREAALAASAGEVSASGPGSGAPAPTLAELDARLALPARQKREPPRP
jgi:hypothetical protein